MNEIKQRVMSLRKNLDQHRYNYHALDAPTISDEVYDSLIHELEQLEKQYPELSDKNSPTKRIGAFPLDHFNKAPHEYPQWSFDNVFNKSELEDWNTRNIRIAEKEGLSKDFTYVSELKIDGLKVVMTYKEGKLIQALTRGDGKVGEDITENVRTIMSVPLVLDEPLNITVIGEAWMKKNDLERINALRAKKSESLYANTRNLAAGTLRLLDSKVVSERRLHIYSYDIEGSNCKTQSEELALLKKLRFEVCEHSRVCENLDEIQAVYESWTNKRNNLDVGIDGLVIKINEKRIFDGLGYTSRSPRAGIAYKFPAECVTTKILTVTFQVGRTGVVTPVATLLPVLVAGSTVMRATLHNEEEIKRLGIMAGDTVVLRKAGDVIPEIIEALKDLRNGSESPIVFPSHCPECSTTLVKRSVGKELSVAWYCENQDCDAKHEERIIHAVGKRALGIDGLGEKQIEQLRDAGLITDVASIYDLNFKDIAGLPRFADKSANNLLDSIDAAKNIPLSRFIYSLGIHHIGEQTAKDIAKAAKNFPSFTSLDYDTLRSIFGIGETAAESMLKYLQSEKGQTELKRLAERIKVLPEEQAESNALNSQTFCITGTFEISRDDIKYIVESAGGKVSASISSKTTALIAGEGGGSKREDAALLGVDIISLDQLKARLGK